MVSTVRFLDGFLEGRQRPALQNATAVTPPSTVLDRSDYFAARPLTRSTSFHALAPQGPLALPRSKSFPTLCGDLWGSNVVNLERFQRLYHLTDESERVSVRRAFDVTTGTDVVLKCMSRNSTQTQTQAHVNQEASLLRKFNHPNILKCFGNFTYAAHHAHSKFATPAKDYLVCEFWQIDLEKAVGNNPMPTQLIRVYIWQLLRGLGVMHASEVAHLDVKPGNIFLDYSNRLALGDFGSAVALTQSRSEKAETTLRYRSPELLANQGNISAAADIWGAGCVLLKMATGEDTFSGDDESDQMTEIAKGLGRLSTEQISGVTTCDAGIAALAKRMLRYDPTARDSAYELLTDPFFDPLRRGEQLPKGVTMRSLFRFKTDEIEGLHVRNVDLNRVLPAGFERMPELGLPWLKHP